MRLPRGSVKHFRNSRQIRRNVPCFVIPTVAQAEWRNPPRGIKNHHKIKPATREDSSTPFPPLGMTCRGWFRSTKRVVFGTLHGGAPRSESKSTDCRGQSHLDSIDESPPLHWVYRVLCNTVQPYRLYSQRGGRLVAAPTGVMPFIRTGYIRNAPGTAHRPFPTVSLVGVFFYTTHSKNGLVRH